LHRAAHHTRDELVDFLLEKGADVNAIGCEGMTPLMFAIDSNSPSIVRTLIEHGADMTTADECGSTPMAHAAFQWVNEDASENERLVFEMLKQAGAPYDIVAASMMSDLNRVQEILSADPKAGSAIPEPMVESVLCAILIHDWGTLSAKEQLLKLLLQSGLQLPNDTVRRTIEGASFKEPDVGKLIALIKEHAGR